MVWKMVQNMLNPGRHRRQHGPSCWCWRCEKQYPYYSIYIYCIYICMYDVYMIIYVNIQLYSYICIYTYSFITITSHIHVHRFPFLAIHSVAGQGFPDKDRPSCAFGHELWAVVKICPLRDALVSSGIMMWLSHDIHHDIPVNVMIQR